MAAPRGRLAVLARHAAAMANLHRGSGEGPSASGEGAARATAALQGQLAHERAVLERVARMDPLADVLVALARGLEGLFPGTVAAVLVLDQSGTRLASAAAPSLAPALVEQLLGLELGHPAPGAGDPRWAPVRELLLGQGLRACAETPILSGQGQVLGTLALHGREPRASEPHELAALESSARIAALAVERHAAEHALRGFAERLELATRSAQMGIFDYDVEHNRLAWDAQMLAIYGVARADFGGRYEDWKQCVHPEDLEAAEARVQASIVGDQPFESSFRIIRPDGSTRFIEARTLMQRDARGVAKRITGVNLDVTAKKELEAQLLRSQRQESIGRLAGGIAHDLNNMLAPMLVGPGILRDLVQDPEGRALLDTIESSARRAASVIRQLLTFSRGGETSMAPVDCSAIADDMLQIIRETFPRNIEARRSGTLSPWTVLGDRTQLHQVLMNLCVNARDEMPDGGVLDLRLENVEVGPELARMHPGTRPGPFVRIRVTDQGRGIRPEHMDRLFEPFFTTKGVGQGTGLGLATVRGIVKSHGGFIVVESEVGRGSRFSVHLPATFEARTPESESPPDNLPRGRGEQVLVVDDEEGIRRVTQSMLERHGYGVLLARSGDEALEMLRARKDELALVLTDLMMPGTDGVELVREIRRRAPALKLVVMSGNIAASAQQSSVAPLVDGMLDKPFTLEALLGMLRGVLARRRS